MLHYEVKDHQTSGSGEEDFFKIFIIYGYDSYLGHMTRPIL